MGRASLMEVSELLDAGYPAALPRPASLPLQSSEDLNKTAAPSFI